MTHICLKVFLYSLSDFAIGLFEDDGARSMRYQPYSPNTGAFHTTPVMIRSAGSSRTDLDAFSSLILSNCRLLLCTQQSDNNVLLWGTASNG